MDQIGIISFNVFNRLLSNLNILLRNNNLSKKEIKALYENEKKRFTKTIQPKLLKFLGDLLAKNYIIFLQEISPELLNSLKNSFSLVYHTKTNDQVDIFIKKEYRVIILPNIFLGKTIVSQEIELKTDKTQKNGLMININWNSKNVVLINVHLHWRANYLEFENFGEKIIGEIKKKFVNLTKLEIIIAGDFNKSCKIVQNHFIKLIKKLSTLSLMNYHHCNPSDFTSHTTDVNESNPYDVIDHILTNFRVNHKTEIINEIDKMEIFIDNQKLIKLLSTNNLEKPEYFSDHKMIKLIEVIKN
jgi:endonuclease/exonuclease/phosphatase family metal-dependent hydrolase